MAEGRFLPLVALTDRTLETTKPLSGGLPIENISRCAGAIRTSGLSTRPLRGLDRLRERDREAQT